MLVANLFIYHFVMVSSDCIVEIDGADRKSVV